MTSSFGPRTIGKRRGADQVFAGRYAWSDVRDRLGDRADYARRIAECCRELLGRVTMLQQTRKQDARVRHGGMHITAGLEVIAEDLADVADLIEAEGYSQGEDLASRRLE